MNLTYIDFLVSGVLATIMFGVGLSINFNDLRQIYRSPKAIVIGLISQMVLLPLIAFVLVGFTDLPPAIKVGFIILAACPGGTTSGFVTVLFRGNVALSCRSDNCQQSYHPCNNTSSCQSCAYCFYRKAFAVRVASCADFSSDLLYNPVAGIQRSTAEVLP